MTAYCIPQDLLDRYGEEELIQITWRGNPGDPRIIDEEVIERACEDATAIIDSYARGRYLTPLLQANQTVVQPFACAIARWHLHEDGHPEHVEHGYKAAIAWLRDLAAGRVGLPDLTPPGGPDGAVFGVAVSAPPAVFTSSRLGAML